MRLKRVWDQALFFQSKEKGATAAIPSNRVLLLVGPEGCIVVDRVHDVQSLEILLLGLLLPESPSQHGLAQGIWGFRVQFFFFTPGWFPPCSV